MSEVSILKDMRMTFVLWWWENSLSTVSGLVQWDLHTIETWCDELGLSVSADKNGPVAFTRRRKIPGFFEPYLFGTTLQRSMSVKYLGVILDLRLT
jgi:hypothetical protein